MYKLITMIFLLLLNSWALEGFAFRDPTRPPDNIIEGQTVVVTPSAFILQAIIRNNGRKIAVINGLHKKIGDEILGQRVTQISSDTVQLEGPGGKITLFLFGPAIKDTGQIQCIGTKVLCKDGKF